MLDFTIPRYNLTLLIIVYVYLSLFKVLYVLIEKEIKTSSPHKRTACAPVLLALAGHASRLVSILFTDQISIT
jgi:hypothetical protein